MKTTFYIIGIALFSALMLSPKAPKAYPPKEVIQQRKKIVCKEIKLNQVISKIECNLAVDSVRISNQN